MLQGVRIIKKKITGVLHPQIVIECILKDEDITLEVWSDNKKIPISEMGSGRRKVIRALLKKENRWVTVYGIQGKKKFELFTIKNTLFRRIFSKIEGVFGKTICILKKMGRWIKYLWTEHHFLVPPFLWKDYGRRIVNKIKAVFHLDFYNPFRKKDFIAWTKRVEEEPIYQDLSYQPLISILIPVYNIQRQYLSECLDSILSQHYENFEVCLVDDCSTLKETKETLEEYKKKDERIKVKYRTENGHISKTTNDALKMAKGEFIALMDNDDVLTDDALYEMVLALNQNKDYDFIYSDEDKLDMKGNRCEPHFKPDYSPDSLYGGNYICHFEILRKKIVDEIGGFRTEYVGAQDFDLFLRFMEKTVPGRVYHIPKILYHWRKVPGSTADTIENKDYAILNGKKAVEDALKRRGLKANVEVPIHSTHYVVNYLYSKEPKVSILIPTRDGVSLLQTCLRSIYDKTDYKNFEVIVINNDSQEEETYQLFEYYQKHYSNFKVIDAPGEFNYAKIHNDVIKKVKGDYLLFLNNDTEVLQKNWISIMVGYAMQPHIGAVGVKLLYPDETIQHGGVILGLGGVATHAFLNYDASSYGFYGRLVVPYDYSAVTAACMMVSKEKFLEVDGFEEKLKVSYNDIDFCLKLREKGYYNVFLPQVELYHYESQSRGLPTTKEKYKQVQEESKYFMNKWGSVLKSDPFYNPNFSLKKGFYLDRKKREK